MTNFANPAFIESRKTVLYNVLTLSASGISAVQAYIADLNTQLGRTVGASDMIEYNQAGTQRLIVGLNEGTYSKDGVALDTSMEVSCWIPTIDPLIPGANKNVVLTISLFSSGIWKDFLDNNSPFLVGGILEGAKMDITTKVKDDASDLAPKIKIEANIKDPRINIEASARYNSEARFAFGHGDILSAADEPFFFAYRMVGQQEPVDGKTYYNPMALSGAFWFKQEGDKQSIKVKNFDYELTANGNVHNVNSFLVDAIYSGTDIGLLNEDRKSVV